MSQVRVDTLSVEVEGRPLINGVVFDLQPVEFVGLVGPIGAGKSSLQRAIARVLKPSSGRVVHLGDDVWQLEAREAARRTAVVAQERMGGFEFTVRELVPMGRTPHGGLFDGDSGNDHVIVARCLDEVGMGHYATRSFLTLSGGEKQRVLVAPALAQEARLFVLDEPTNHLDIRHQLELLTLVRRLKTTTLAALHDLTLPARYCDRIAMLHAGRLIAFGPPADVLTAERIRHAYGVLATVSGEAGRIRIEFDLEHCVPLIGGPAPNGTFLRNVHSMPDPDQAAILARSSGMRARLGPASRSVAADADRATAAAREAGLSDRRGQGRT